jgi:hypothetical protein
MSATPVNRSNTKKICTKAYEPDGFSKRAIMEARGYQWNEETRRWE